MVTTTDLSIEITVVLPANWFRFRQELTKSLNQFFPAWTFVTRFEEDLGSIELYDSSRPLSPVRKKQVTMILDGCADLIRSGRLGVA